MVKEQVRLVKPSVVYKAAYMAFYQDWLKSGELMVPWVIAKDPSNFEEMIASLRRSEQGMDIPEGWVKDSTFWLVTESDNVVGAVNIRHELTDKLFNSGGHIGYGIRPGERQNGYGSRILELSLKKARELGIVNVLVVCDSHNTASKKVILRNGGVQDQDYIEPDGNVVERFWISDVE
ncbi:MULTISPECIES: GNAT family N-acetyltransferase [Paenibacillus]|uniref:GNAT family N-acetyltransferase n=1 Tax=Paenibacillus xylanilyticus TaxID=248903 RepID=A0A7Y6C4V6_9BACL|nr:GNAT family N-acetyltransferase [Paenibacillus xylanilyticus]NUU79549.1 GNAT family N-acetyltransferase [Paenibacillus xylanilyticus]